MQRSYHRKKKLTVILISHNMQFISFLHQSSKEIVSNSYGTVFRLILCESSNDHGKVSFY